MTAPRTRAPTRKRLPAKIREQHILDEAIRYFAEHGVPGQMRELARRIGVTHPLLYRYFKDRDALIERIYQELFLARWQADWGAALADGSVALEQRLVDFYSAYLASIDDPAWMRIFMYAGLKAVGLNQRYMDMIMIAVIRPVAAAVRTMGGGPEVAQLALTRGEVDATLGLHGQLFYCLVRKWIYGMPVPAIDATLLRPLIRQFLAGAPAALHSITPP